MHKLPLGLYVKGCNSDASQNILWVQVVTCLAHSRKHFKTSLADCWIGERGEGGWGWMKGGGER